MHIYLICLIRESKEVSYRGPVHRKAFLYICQSVKSCRSSSSAHFQMPPAKDSPTGDTEHFRHRMEGRKDSSVVVDAIQFMYTCFKIPTLGPRVEIQCGCKAKHSNHCLLLSCHSETSLPYDGKLN